MYKNFIFIKKINKPNFICAESNKVQRSGSIDDDEDEVSFLSFNKYISPVN